MYRTVAVHVYEGSAEAREIEVLGRPIVGPQIKKKYSTSPGNAAATEGG